MKSDKEPMSKESNRTAEEIREKAIIRMGEIYPLANEDDFPENPNVNKVNHRCRGAYMSGVDFALRHNSLQSEVERLKNQLQIEITANETLRRQNAELKEENESLKEKLNII